MATGIGNSVAESTTISASGIAYGGAVFVEEPLAVGTGHSGNHGLGDVEALFSEESGLGFAGFIGLGDFFLNTPIVGGYGQSIKLTAELVEVSAVGARGNVGTGSAATASVDLASTALFGGVGLGDVVIEYQDISASSGVIGSVDTESPTVAAEGATGVVGVGSVVTRSAIAEGLVLRDGSGIGTVVARAAKVISDAASDGSGSGTGSISTAEATSNVVILAGAAGIGVVRISEPTISAISVVSGTGTGVFVAPHAVVVGELDAAVTGIFTGVAVNTRVAGVTEYTGLNINSACLFNGTYLAATNTGIVELTGTTDDGTLIQSSVRGGFTDFGNKNNKRVLYAYPSVDSDGILNISLQSDTSVEHLYRLIPRRLGIHQAKVKLGHGVRGIHWKWGLDNNGNDFRLNNIAFEVESLGRRIA
jgi:hypothetical protein